jgi:hypothetical protein
MKKQKYFKYILFLMIIVFCASFDYVYVDNKTFHRQLSYIKNGFVSIVLQIDPTKEDTSRNYAAPGKIIKEKVFKKKDQISSELIKGILDVTKRNNRYSGEGWYPTFEIYIKFTDRLLFIIPSAKNLLILFDFKNSIVFIEGRKFVFNAQEAELLKANLDYLLNNPSP